LCLIFCLLSLVSCKKDVIVQNSIPTKYPVIYRFINTSGNTLRDASFTARTYFPVENETNLNTIGSLNVLSKDTITTTDSSPLGYIGCATQMEVVVYMNINDSLVYLSTWYTETDTIRCQADAKVYFYWPNDTLYSEKGYSKSYYTYSDKKLINNNF